MSLDQFDDSSEHSPLPFGQQVLSEAFEAQYSTLITTNPLGLNQPLASFKDTIKSLKNILGDQGLSMSKRINQSLKILEKQVLNPCQTKREAKNNQQQPRDRQQQKEYFKEQQTININLESLEDIQLQLYKQQKNSEKTLTIDQQINKAGIDGLKRQLHEKQNQILLIKKEKKQNQMRLQKQIQKLTSKLQQIGNGSLQPKKSGKIQESSQQMAKMNKWLETLNKLLQGAQRQAAISKEQLKKYQQMSGKQLKQKDEEIRLLNQQLGSFRSNLSQSTNSICSFIKQFIFMKTNIKQRQGLKEQIINFIQFST